MSLLKPCSRKNVCVCCFRSERARGVADRVGLLPAHDVHEEGCELVHQSTRLQGESSMLRFKVLRAIQTHQTTQSSCVAGWEWDDAPSARESFRFSLDALCLFHTNSVHTSRCTHKYAHKLCLNACNSRNFPCVPLSPWIVDIFAACDESWLQVPSFCHAVGAREFRRRIQSLRRAPVTEWTPRDMVTLFCAKARDINFRFH